MHRRTRPLLELLIPGVLAFLVAGLSIVDMFLPKPYDGVVLEADAPGRMVVRQVMPGSGAQAAGIHPGDVIVGIDHSVLESTGQAAEQLNRHHIGDTVAYLVRSGEHVREVEVRLGRRHIGDTMYLLACLLGFVFFFVGWFVVSHQPRLPAARVFFMMSVLFMLFLVCRLRPASYSWVDAFVLTTGTLALLFLPATFLHFFMIFPRPVWQWRHDPLARAAEALDRYAALWPTIYFLPVTVYAANVAFASRSGRSLALISGAPAANWWVMLVYMVLGLGALAVSARSLPEPRQRSGAAIVFIGTVFGVVPFLLLAVAAPSFFHTEKFLFYGVLPLILVPLTFAYAIVRFQLLEIRVLLRKSLLYTITTAVITGLYAGGIAAFNWLFSGTAIAESRYFPVVFALTIVLLFEPLRRTIQEPVTRFFFRGRTQLRRAMDEMGEAFAAQVDLEPVVRELVERLPQLLGLEFAALYLVRGSSLVRVAGPTSLPERLPDLHVLRDHLARRGGIVRMAQLAPLEMLSPKIETINRQLEQAGVEHIGVLASPRRGIGIVLLSRSPGQIVLEAEDLRLLRGLLRQASIALETSLLLEEKTHQAQIERELKIAAAIQQSLLPADIGMIDGWRVAAVCRPAREVGGDFFTMLPGRDTSQRMIVYGDVSGKSIPGALLMMAAHEVLHALAIEHPEPGELFDLVNRRIHALRRGSTVLGRGSFVALGSLACRPGERRLEYCLAGQPPPLIRRSRGPVEELPLPAHRIPVGALAGGGYTAMSVPMGDGDVVVAYSDGVIEAMSPEGEFFGSARLKHVIAAAEPDPQQIVEGVLRALDGFTEGRAPYDDITLVALGCS